MAVGRTHWLLVVDYQDVGGDQRNQRHPACTVHLPHAVHPMRMTELTLYSHWLRPGVAALAGLAVRGLITLSVITSAPHRCGLRRECGSALCEAWIEVLCKHSTVDRVPSAACGQRPLDTALTLWCLPFAFPIAIPSGMSARCGSAAGEQTRRIPRPGERMGVDRPAIARAPGLVGPVRYGIMVLRGASPI